MGIFARLSDIITANLNAILDKAENPERMLSQIIREMEEGLDRAREHGATAIAAERRLRRELESNRAAAQHAKEQARSALTGAREDLARRALAQKLEADDVVHELESQLAAAEQMSVEVRAALHALEMRLTEARRRHRLLISRQRAASIRLLISQSVGTQTGHLADPLTRFSRFEERLLDLEDHLRARAEISRAPAEIETELHELALNRRIDDALEELRREMK